MKQPMMVIAREYGPRTAATLLLALSRIPSHAKLIIDGGPWMIDQNVTFPETVAVEIYPDSVMNIDAGILLTIDSISFLVHRADWYAGDGAVEGIGTSGATIGLVSEAVYAQKLRGSAAGDGLSVTDGVASVVPATDADIGGVRFASATELQAMTAEDRVPSPATLAGFIGRNIEVFSTSGVSTRQFTLTNSSQRLEFEAGTGAVSSFYLTASGGIYATGLTGTWNNTWISKNGKWIYTKSGTGFRFEWANNRWELWGATALLLATSTEDVSSPSAVTAWSFQPLVFLDSFVFSSIVAATNNVSRIGVIITPSLPGSKFLLMGNLYLACSNANLSARIFLNRQVAAGAPSEIGSAPESGGVPGCFGAACEASTTYGRISAAPILYVDSPVYSAGDDLLYFITFGCGGADQIRINKNFYAPADNYNQICTSHFMVMELPQKA